MRPFFFAMDLPEYKTSDFKGIMREIFDIPEGKSILQNTKKLNYPEFKVSLLNYNLDKDKVIRYITCVYDKNSPFRIDYLDVPYRKIMACLYVGFEMDEFSKFEDNVTQMMLCENQLINKMIVRYGRVFKDKEYSYLIALEDEFYRLLEGMHAGDKTNTNKIKEVKNEIHNSTKLLLEDDNSKFLREELYSFLEADELELRPEHIATKIKDGVPPITDKEIQEYKSADPKGV